MLRIKTLALSARTTPQIMVYNKVDQLEGARPISTRSELKQLKATMLWPGDQAEQLEQSNAPSVYPHGSHPVPLSSSPAKHQV